MADADAVFPAALCERFIRDYSGAGDLVFDPFAGFGTTLAAAQRFGRRAFGIELHAGRYEYLLRRFGAETVVHGDVFELPVERIPQVDLLLTSPPYWDPAGAAFSAYATADEGYARWLERCGALFERLRPKLRRGAWLVIVVQNIRVTSPRPQFYPLAWDVGRLLASLFELDREWIACTTGEAERDRYGDHLYCLTARAG